MLNDHNMLHTSKSHIGPVSRPIDGDNLIVWKTAILKASAAYFSLSYFGMPDVVVRRVMLIHPVDIKCNTGIIISIAKPGAFVQNWVFGFGIHTGLIAFGSVCTM